MSNRSVLDSNTEDVILKRVDASNTEEFGLVPRDGGLFCGVRPTRLAANTTMKLQGRGEG